MNLNIFQRSKTHKYSALQLTVEPSWSERNYASFAEEGYIKNVIAFRAINMIANAASSVPFVLYRLTSQTDKSPPIARNYFILLSFMTLNEKRKAFGLPPLPGGGLTLFL